jgi:hypothetical protein
MQEGISQLEMLPLIKREGARYWRRIDVWFNSLLFCVYKLGHVKIFIKMAINRTKQEFFLRAITENAHFFNCAKFRKNRSECFVIIIRAAFHSTFQQYFDFFISNYA